MNSSESQPVDILRQVRGSDNALSFEKDGSRVWKPSTLLASFNGFGQRRYCMDRICLFQTKRISPVFLVINQSFLDTDELPLDWKHA